MAREYIVGLFQSKGTAEDAAHRLHTEGVPRSMISMIVLHEWAEKPQAVSPVVETLTVDPLLVGDVRDTFAPYIHNGETVIFVEVATDAGVELAVDTIRQYSPVKIRLLVADEAALVGRDVL